MAVVTLLYGCGLRISEALGLMGRDLPLGESMRIIGKGGKERVVPVLPVARHALETYVRLCPFEMEPDAPVFRGVRGGGLNARNVQKVTEQARMQLGLPATATPHAMRHSFAHIFWQLAAICGRFRNCWDTRPCRRHRPIRRWTRST